MLRCATAWPRWRDTYRIAIMTLYFGLFFLSRSQDACRRWWIHACARFVWAHGGPELVQRRKCTCLLGWFRKKQAMVVRVALAESLVLNHHLRLNTRQSHAEKQRHSSLFVCKQVPSINQHVCKIILRKTFNGLISDSQKFKKHFSMIRRLTCFCFCFFFYSSVVQQQLHRCNLLMSQTYLQISPSSFHLFTLI